MNLPSAADIAAAFCRSLDGAVRYAEPYPHFYADDLFPEVIVAELAALPFAAPDQSGTSGRREDNKARIFFGAVEMARFPVMRAVAEALQSASVVGRIGALSAAPLRGCHLRLEYAIDEDGFWLAPHTDLGVKKFTGLISITNGHTNGNEPSNLGTDIYDAENKFYKRAPFRRNGALMFVPSPETSHGFAHRPIEGSRRSIILNYVGADWQARDQLSFPEEPVGIVV